MKKLTLTIPDYTNIPPIPVGKNRQWLECKECGLVAYYDFIPYGLSSPITWTTCGHSTGYSDLNCHRITPDEAIVKMAALIKQRAA